MIARFVCVLGLLLLPVAAQAQTFKYLAYGDSITCGKYDSENGTQGVCTGKEPLPNPTTLTGYPHRLSGNLGCNGSNCQIYNYGDPGEDTILGVTRLDSVLSDSNSPYDVMILMHGTNDVIAGRSHTFIENQLKNMNNKATAAGVDTVFASIIRFDPAGTRWTQAAEDTIANLRNSLISTAASRGAWFTDPWGVLCFSANCFANHYTGGDNGQRIHPDASGYNKLGDEIHAGVTQQAVPGAPSLLGPADGADIAAGANLTWSSTNHTTWYQVDWSGASSGSQWLTASACAGGTCSFTVPGLPPGDYDWMVRGRNPHGRSAWSTSRAFTFYTSAPPVPTAVSPIVDTYTTPPSEFTWTEVNPATNGSTRYQLKVERDGTEIFNADVPTPPNCSGGNCSHDPGFAWTPATYAWQVRSENPAGNSAWSTEAGFVFTDVAPAAPTALQPSVDTFDATPLLIWTNEFGAAEYVVQIDADPEETVDAGTVCTALDCRWAPAGALALDNHSWKVRSWNPEGFSAYSSSLNFEVLDCTSFPDLLLNSGSASGGTVQEAACHTITAAGTYHVTGTGVLELHAGDEIVFQDGFMVEAGGELHARIDP